MKKMGLFLMGLSMAFMVSATSFKEGKQYESLKEPVLGDQQRVAEFFSFYCGHCYVFDKDLQVFQKIKEVVPEGVKIEQYHVEFLGTWGKELTKTWLIAQKLKVADKIKPLLFEAVQTEKKLETKDAKAVEAIIGEIFAKVGKKAEYDEAKISFDVKSLLKQQEEMAEKLKVNGVPAVYVDGKYRIKSEGIDTTSKAAYAKEYAEVVKFLLNQ
ncbi:DSBA-like thioredoxin protein [Candidatus Regiella insecticola 5.15]|uniref:Thiol:disulfide interchange protein n=1 Tax=Candidatus Regiella insecticola 5.15 TaxID=1005043 RepID=G2H083_9ENTR|nr:protein disulfide oxidoreductase DsbA [Candidatus Regiella insecticola]EGY28610.1 DSBA-like thioredoxin protein [Candidatus Regiella insecticola 5.15]